METRKILILVLLIFIIFFIILYFVFFTGDEQPPLEIGTEIDFGTSNTVDIDILPVSTRSVLSESDQIKRANENIEELSDIRLVRIFFSPVAGFNLDTEDNEPIINIVEQGTGYFHKLNTLSYNIKRTSNTTILKTFAAEFGSELLSTIQFEDEEGLAASIIFSPQNSEDTTFLTDSEAVTISKDNLVFSLESNEDGGVDGIVIDPINKTRESIWSSPFKSWTAYWGVKENITLITKPSYFSEGFAYLLSPTTGELTRVAGGERGLNILYNNSQTKFLKTNNSGSYIVNENGDEIKLSSRILPEKCAWYEDEYIVCGVFKRFPETSFSGETIYLPDSWYLGDVSFSDSIVLFNGETGAQTVLIDPADFGYTLDIISPQFFIGGDIFIFIDKIDRTLWYAQLR